MSGPPHPSDPRESNEHRTLLASSPRSHAARIHNGSISPKESTKIEDTNPKLEYFKKMKEQILKYRETTANFYEAQAKNEALKFKEERRKANEKFDSALRDLNFMSTTMRNFRFSRSNLYDKKNDPLLKLGSVENELTLPCKLEDQKNLVSVFKELSLATNQLEKFGESSIPSASELEEQNSKLIKLSQDFEKVRECTKKWTKEDRHPTKNGF